eukprot:g5459.t1
MKCIGAGFVTGFVGDTLAQRLEPQDEEEGAERSTDAGGTDLVRSALWGVYMAGLNGVLVREWLFVLERRFGARLLPKIAADQLVMAPLATVSCLTFSGWLQDQRRFARAVQAGTTPAQSSWSLADRVGENLGHIWGVDCLFWPLANTVNFTQVRLIYRPIFTSVADLVWSTFLAYYTMHVARVDGEKVAAVAGGAAPLGGAVVGAAADGSNSKVDDRR